MPHFPQIEIARKAPAAAIERARQATTRKRKTQAIKQAGMWRRLLSAYLGYAKGQA